MLQTFCNSFSEQLLFNFFAFFENLLEKASRTNDLVFKGYKSNQSSFVGIFYPLALKRDLWLWILRPQTTTEWVFRFFNWRGLAIVWCKLTFFHSLTRVYCQAFHWHCITFSWQPRQAKLKTYINSFPEWLLYVLFAFFENLLEMATRRKYSVL